MPPPTPQELEHHVGEVGWSLVSMCKHMLVSRSGDRDEHVDRAQAGFDGALIHMRAICEFFVAHPKDKGPISGEDFCSVWNGGAAARARNFDMNTLLDDLNTHAAHLSRARFSNVPAPGWDPVPRIGGLLELFGDLVDCCSDAHLRQLLFDQLTEARLQFNRIAQV